MFLSSPQQQEILQSDAPEEAATQTVEPQVKELGNGATAEIGGSFARFCETHFPSAFSFRELKKKLSLFYRQALPGATTVKMEIAAPSRRQVNQVGQFRGKKQASLPHSCNEPDQLQDLEMENGCYEFNSSAALVQRAAGKDQASTKNAFKNATFKPHPILKAEDNHFPPLNLTSEALEAVGAQKIDHGPLSLDDDALLQLRQILPASEIEVNLSIEAGFGEINLQLDISSSTVEVPTVDLSNYEAYPQEKAILAVKSSRAPNNFQPLENHDSTLQYPWQALTRSGGTGFDGKSGIQSLATEKPATKMEKCDPISTSNHFSCKQTCPLEASDRIDYNLQEIDASSALVYMKNVKVENEAGRAAYAQGQDTSSLHPGANNHTTLSVWEPHEDNRLRKRIADAQSVDTCHQIKVLRQSAMLDLAQTRLILSQIVLHRN